MSQMWWHLKKMILSDNNSNIIHNNINILLVPDLWGFQTLPVTMRKIKSLPCWNEASSSQSSSTRSRPDVS
jgi:hypothetical protein